MELRYKICFCGVRRLYRVTVNIAKEDYGELGIYYSC